MTMITRESAKKKIVSILSQCNDQRNAKGYVNGIDNLLDNVHFPRDLRTKVLKSLSKLGVLIKLGTDNYVYNPSKVKHVNQIIDGFMETLEPLDYVKKYPEVVESINQGLNIKQVCSRNNISNSTVISVKKDMKHKGIYNPKRKKKIPITYKGDDLGVLSELKRLNNKIDVLIRIFDK